jgi:hypothetical protein
MSTIKSFLFILILMLLSSSCNNMQVFRMDVLKPGFVVVPSQKSNIVIVDNSGVQPRGAGHEVKVGFKEVGDTAFNLEPLSGMLIGSLCNYLLKEGFYQRISPLYRSDLLPGKTQEDDYLRSGRLSIAKIREISQDTSVHMLFSMDRLLTKTSTNTYYTGETYTATRDVWVNSVWRVYDLDKDTLIAQFQYNDSLYWQKYSQNPYIVTKSLPEMEIVLPEIGDVVAEHLNKFLGPHWETEKRQYFCTGGYRMKMAADLVRKDLIEDAAKLWEMEFAKGIFRSKYRAAINMMFYEEVKGNPKQALIWEDRAEEAVLNCPIGGSDYDIAMLAQWKKLLEDRIKEFQKLKIYFDGNLN